MAKINVQFNTANNTITVGRGADWVNGNGYRAIFRLTDPNGSIIYKNDGYDSQDLSNPDVDDNNELVIPNFNPDFDGIYNIDGLFIDNPNYYKLIKIDEEVFYSFKPPVGDLNISYDCEIPQLVLTDNTDYTTIVGGSSVSPSNKSRKLTYKYPENIEGGAPFDKIEYNVNSITIGDLYTQLSQGFLEAQLSYELGTANWFVSYEVYAEIAGYTYVDVKCDDCTCKMYDCIDQLFTQWQNAAGMNGADKANPSDKQKLQNLIIKLLTLQAQYAEARRCERDTSKICAEILATINLTGCTCCEETNDSAYATLVDSSGTSGGGTTIYSVDTTPTSIGSDGDWAILNQDDGVNLQGDLFHKEAGIWIFKFNITGGAGADGSSSGNIINSDYTSVSTLPGTDDSTTITIPFDGVNELTTKGDRMLLRFGIRVLGDLDSGSKINIYDTDGNMDSFEFDVERTNADAPVTDMNFEIEFALIRVPTKVKMDGKVSIRGEYNDIINFNDDEFDISGTDLNVVIKRTNVGGGGSQINYNGHDLTFFKAI